jgi:glycosyltransferase involved in cell wall biosynthesis
VSLTILNVAYPLAPVGPDAVGGAEQILTQIDHGLVACGHHSIVIAQAGSQTAGTFVPVPVENGVLDELARRRAQCRHRDAIIAALQRWPVHIVHLHGIDFDRYLPPPGVPVLVTLHLPASWYPQDALAPSRPATWLHCVGSAQHEACPKHPRLLPPIPNGVAVDRLAVSHAKRRFAVVLGRICPEKGVHLAIEAARRADIPLLIAGEVFPYEAHRRYFDEEVRPRLDSKRRFIGPVGFVRKRRLLSAAQCLLVASLAPETSSLVAREALACGTPVVGFPNGALPETIEHGRTGFLVETVEAMADAIGEATKLDPHLCRNEAGRRFSAGRMIQRYVELYEALVGRRAGPARLEGAA